MVSGGPGPIDSGPAMQAAERPGKANIRKCFSHRFGPGRLSAFIGLMFMTTRGRLIFRLYAIIQIAHYYQDYLRTTSVYPYFRIPAMKYTGC
jgi:hypothetical protein